MEHTKLCQSCSMPLDNEEVLGTEKNGSKSQQYCKYCYQEGAFVNPDMKLEEMAAFIKGKMAEMHISKNIIENAVNALPYLGRWRPVTQVK